MKNLKLKMIITTVFVFFVLCILSLTVSATNEEIEILKKGEKDYIIYTPTDSEFEFAFANSSETKVGDLTFLPSITDTNGNNVAYMDSTMPEEYFISTMYLWVRNATDETMLINGIAIDLTDVITDDMVEEILDITKRIKVNMDGKNEEEKVIDGVKTTITTGKVEITDDKDSEYKYQLIKVTENNKDFVTLAENINKATNMFDKLKAYKNFYNRYHELEPSFRDTSWQEVNNMVIPQPESSENGDKYILWLMKDGDIIDLQILTCTRLEDKGQETEKVIVKETSKLPFTYDSIALFVILGILVVMLIALIIVKKRKTNNEK